MHYLRAIVLIFINCIAWAEPAQISFNTIASSAAGNTSVIFPNSQRREGFQQYISLQSSRFSGFKISSTYVEMKNNYSNFILDNQEGVESKLGDAFNQPERNGTLSVDYTKSQLGFNLTHSGSLSESPFKFNLSKLSQTTRFNHDLSQITVAYSFGQVAQPLSYFTNLVTRLRQARLEQINLNNISVSWDQIQSYRLRTNVMVETNEKSDRPRSVGVVGRASYALSDRDFIRGETAYYTELRSFSLRDERGYFDLYSGELTYSRYLTYDLVLNFTYGLVVETEDNALAFRKDRFATDVYTLASTYQGTDWSAGLRLQQLVSNLAFQSTIVGGQFTWVF